MPRKRVIDPGFWTDSILGTMPLETRLLYIASWNLANDAGLLEGDPAWIRAQVFPYDQRIQVEDVERCVMQLINSRRLLLYEVQGRRYLVIAKFHRWQKVAHPAESKLPMPPVDVLAQLEDKCQLALLSRFNGVTERARDDSRGLVNPQRSLSPNSTERNRTQSNEVERKGDRGKGSIEGDPAPSDISCKEDAIRYLEGCEIAYQTNPTPETRTAQLAARSTAKEHGWVS